MRGARDHDAAWAAYLHERLTDEGQSVFATLKFASQAFKDGEIDPQRFAQDASIAIPPACIGEWMNACVARNGQPSEALDRELGEIYDRHVPQSRRWETSFGRMCERLGLPREESRLAEIE